jgi:hypothetical protein
VAQATASFVANALQTHRQCQIFAAVFEQPRSLGRADQLARQHPCLNTTAIIEPAKLRHRLLNDAPPYTNAANQAPITVNLPSFLRIVWRRYIRHHNRNSRERKYPRTPKSAFRDD